MALTLLANCPRARCSSNPAASYQSVLEPEVPLMWLRCVKFQFRTVVYDSADSVIVVTSGSAGLRSINAPIIEARTAKTAPTKNAA